MSQRSDLTSPRHWVHYLYFPEEADARRAGAAITAAGWEIQALEPAVEGTSWVVVPEQHDAVVSESAVVAARQFFEDVAARVPGAEYDGWEASA
ncbi:ribonuclease E inhibitor RraB [Quadrisphaera oryzae]|uniref:ribonuclease E inhibitor RraB n=1 Tax=Quadrisphaera TaxID=317661 RepID=UPI00164771EE|nr:ribonuclease E inhibitor RraB [Quadrisphaera sp. RL12-1S]MBC3761012.1 ribonuclease E inhibitor RraB [Quadrisphaera sp. RL12-1S]